MAGSYGGRISLEPPTARLIAEQSCLNNPKSPHLKNVAAHPLNHAVEVLAPTDRLPTGLAAASPAADLYYAADQLPLLKLLDSSFRQLAGEGSVCGVTVGAAVDGGCVAAVLPTGQLVLSLDRPTYHSLGLQGKPSHIDPKQRFLVTVDLSDPGLSPGSKRLTRLEWCFTDRLDLCFDFLFVYTPDGGSGGVECPVLAALGAAKVVDPEEVQYAQMQTPRFETAVAAELMDSEFFDLSEWLGVVGCRLEIDGAPDGYHSTLACPEPSAAAPLAVSRWRGMIGSARVAALLAAAQESVQSGEAPWVALQVWGFEDAPVSWGSREHGHAEGGENHYTYVVGPDGRYLLFTMLDPADPCP